MMQDWNAYRSALFERIGEYAQLNPEVVRGVRTLDGAAAASGKLAPKIHELIALAVAVTTRCDGCITIHAKNALDAGATKEEIAEALSVAIALNTGSAMIYSVRVLDAVAALEDAWQPD
jgi:AhpD family alkylhydroperoxidase